MAPGFPGRGNPYDGQDARRSSRFHDAKAGDPDAALNLAGDLLDNAMIQTLGNLVGNRKPQLLPVVADEIAGFNAIPDAMAQTIGRQLSLRVVAGEIVQTNRVGHTRAPAFQRLVTPAMFDGDVEPGAAYILVDDHIGLGGTLANLRGYVELRGGSVIGITTLTESREAKRISLRSSTRDMLWDRHGHALDQFWRAQFGYGIDCLTEVEALQLCRQRSIAAIEDFLAQAAIEARGRGIAPAV